MNEILRNYLLAVFKGCIVLMDNPYETPKQLSDKGQDLYGQDINYRDTDALVYAVNRHVFGQKFANFIDDSLSADNYYGENDDALGLDELLINQNDDDFGDDLSEQNYSDAINQRIKQISKRLSLDDALSSNAFHKMKALTSYDNFDYIYDTRHIPSGKLTKIIAELRSHVLDRLEDEDSQDDVRFVNILMALIVVALIVIACVWCFVPTSHNNTKPTPKPTVQRYISNRYGTYHLPRHITKITYNPKSQTLYLNLTKHASKVYLKDSVERQSYDESFDNIINNLNTKSKDNHSGCIIILKNGYHYIIKRNPKLQAIHNKHVAEQEKQEREQDKDENNYHPAIFIPPAE